jgi:hypothetical protein
MKYASGSSVEFNDQLPSKEQAMAVIMNEYGCSRAQSYRYVSDAMSVLAILWPIKRS